MDGPRMFHEISSTPIGMGSERCSTSHGDATVRPDSSAEVQTGRWGTNTDKQPRRIVGLYATMM